MIADKPGPHEGVELYVEAVHDGGYHGTLEAGRVYRAVRKRYSKSDLGGVYIIVDDALVCGASVDGLTKLFMLNNEYSVSTKAAYEIQWGVDPVPVVSSEEKKRVLEGMVKEAIDAILKKDLKIVLDVRGGILTPGCDPCQGLIAHLEYEGIPVSSSQTVCINIEKDSF